MKIRLCILFIFQCLSLFSLAGDIWPTIQVENLHGKIKNLSDYAPDKGAVLFVFWKTCCPNNITMIDELCKVYSEYDSKSNPLKIILVSVDDQQTLSRVMPIVRSNGWEFDVLLDKNMDMARIYQVVMPPQWILCDNTGNLIYSSKIMNGYLDSAIYFNEIIKRITK